MIRTAPLIAAGMAALSLGFATGTAHAGPQVNIQIGSSYPVAAQPALVAVQYQAPPPPRYERVPAPRRGMVWSQGHWEWRGHRHVWVPGTWIRVRPGYAYRQPGWVQNGNRWQYHRGGWDRDGDGVPNRHDRRPDNPYRN